MSECSWCGVSIPDGWDHSCTWPDTKHHIERLSAQLATALRERDELRKRVQQLTEENRVQSDSGDTFGEMQQALRVVMRERDEAKMAHEVTKLSLSQTDAFLATAVEALEWYGSMLGPSGRRHDLSERARRALATIRGTEGK